MAPELAKSLLRSSSTTEGLTEQKTKTQLTAKASGRVEKAEQHSRYVGEVERCRGGEDVGVVFGARLLEAMQRGVAVVFREALVFVALSGQLHRGVLRKGHTHFSAVKTLAIQVAHS